MPVYRCPTCHHANVKEPLVDQLAIAIESFDRARAAVDDQERRRWLERLQQALREVEGGVESLRHGSHAMERESDAAASSRPKAYEPGTPHRDPPPPELHAWLNRTLAPPAEAPPAAADPEPMRALPPPVASSLAALKTQLQTPAPPNRAPRTPLRAALRALESLLAELARHQEEARPLSAALQQLLAVSQLDRERALSLLSFVEALDGSARRWSKPIEQRELVGELIGAAEACRRELGVSLAIVERPAAADVEASHPRAKAKANGKPRRS